MAIVVTCPATRPKEFEVYTICLSPDGKLLAIVGSNNTNYLLETSTGKVVREIKENVGGLGFSKDGRILAMQVIRLAEPRANDRPHPVCLEGERACPPEDCGGIWRPDGPRYATTPKLEQCRFLLDATNEQVTIMQAGLCFCLTGRRVGA